jgi:CheY-like chemotaxis protein
MNLVLNAQDAMPSGGQLRIEIRNVAVDAALASSIVGARAGEFVCMTVADSGTGIPQEVLPRIFEPFFSTKEQGKGTGLGLSIVHGVVTQCGGFIEVRSGAGAGTAFALYFPRAQAEAPVALGPGTSAHRTLRRARVYVVDDQPAVLQTIQRVLEAERHEVASFSSAEDALRADASAGAPDLLVTDLVMPNLGGLELADKLAARFPGLRVLIVSGYAESAQLDLIARLPSEALLAKPFTPAELCAKIHAALASLPAWVELPARDVRRRSPAAGGSAHGVALPKPSRDRAGSRL